MNVLRSMLFRWKKYKVVRTFEFASLRFLVSIITNLRKTSMRTCLNNLKLAYGNSKNYRMIPNLPGLVNRLYRKKHINYKREFLEKLIKNARDCRNREDGSESLFHILLKSSKRRSFMKVRSFVNRREASKILFDTFIKKVESLKKFSIERLQDNLEKFRIKRDNQFTGSSVISIALQKQKLRTLAEAYAKILQFSMRQKDIQAVKDNYGKKLARKVSDYVLRNMIFSFDKLKRYSIQRKSALFNLVDVFKLLMNRRKIQVFMFLRFYAEIAKEIDNSLLNQSLVRAERASYLQRQFDKIQKFYDSKLAAKSLFRILQNNRKNSMAFAFREIINNNNFNSYQWSAVTLIFAQKLKHFQMHMQQKYKAAAFSMIKLYPLSNTRLSALLDNSTPKIIQDDESISKMFDRISRIYKLGSFRLMNLAFNMISRKVYTDMKNNLVANEKQDTENKTKFANSLQRFCENYTFRLKNNGFRAMFWMALNDPYSHLLLSKYGRLSSLKTPAEAMASALQRFRDLCCLKLKNQAFQSIIVNQHKQAFDALNTLLKLMAIFKKKYILTLSSAINIWRTDLTVCKAEFLISKRLMNVKKIEKEKVIREILETIQEHEGLHEDVVKLITTGGGNENPETSEIQLRPKFDERNRSPSMFASLPPSARGSRLLDLPKNNYDPRYSAMTVPYLSDDKSFNSEARNPFTRKNLEDIGQEEDYDSKSEKSSSNTGNKTKSNNNTKRGSIEQDIFGPMAQSQVLTLQIPSSSDRERKNSDTS